MESRPELNSHYNEDSSAQFTPALQNGSIPAPGTPGAGNIALPASPYSPGMRSNMALQRRQSNEPNPFDNVSAGEIQMQSFQEGLPPPPPAQHSWKKINRWAEENYEELHDQLSEGATQNDVNELEHELDISLPVEVRESLQTHDGQERGGRPTGIIFGCMLLDCEEIVQEWQNWKVVNEAYLSPPSSSHGMPLPKAFAGPSSSSFNSLSQQQSANPLWRQQLVERQDSQPPRAVQKAYAHPGWIPLARDWGGNNLAVDLAPGAAGTWGQVIIFGRDYDCKYVVARSWSAFLAMVADDLQSGRWFVEEETQELKLREFKTTNVEPGYLDILRWRMDQKYGRRNNRRRGPGPGSPRHSNASGSPYGSPTDERGRSPQRFPTRGPQGSVTSPTQVGKPSPLGIVSEENNLPKLDTDVRSKKEFTRQDSNLMELNTPTIDDAQKHKSFVDKIPSDTLSNATNGSKRPASKITGLGVDGVDDMKSVDI
ncbi:uncharacterized protein KY384_003636 [Bacidia gigantensis]|uniref:uncharacterized protein n=1 Tax=Bacidia gigantensis TaxID=2732470 RepID=UPI001D03CB5F|nr:uncharacterized protein KY384_003636 [Bacidia gigantensis]KAG8532000.1 hypothetical protein KY384_003636 [Bacidia gigantensis]